MKSEAVNTLLVRKYNQPVPRYTSYPTVPHWKNDLTPVQWLTQFSDKFHEQNHLNGISVYIHLPFCESLCTYCGCNKKITTNHKVEDEYLSALEKEWLLYRKVMKQTPVIRELHLGGGTPTFFSPKNLHKLLNFILKGSIKHPQHEFSVEGHPNNTTVEHLKVLYTHGFRRISLGVQDNDPEVQRIINRVQPFENVKNATEAARSLGFKSVNFDLIYGLPKQSLQSIENTIEHVLDLMPDRIAFYSYAHVPWTSKAQRLFDEHDLPAAEEKILLYLKGKELLLKKGYVDIGMDHFALPTDDLYKAWKAEKLHRNFMGYTTQNSGLLLGLGVSSISDTGNAFAQNYKTLHEYYEVINSGKVATFKGHVLNKEETKIKNSILDIACKGETTFGEDDIEALEKHTFPRLEELKKDGLITWNRNGLKLTTQGRFFIRNVCSAFDLYLLQPLNETKIFSKAI
jgi:oxygen-independent coproporphyrinogen-3 oxidase